jgi:hypothetical protein
MLADWAMAPPNPNASSPGWATITISDRGACRSRTGRQIEDTAGRIPA